MAHKQQKEVEAQVRFKMEQFMDWLKNTANWEKRNAFVPDMPVQKIGELWESSVIKGLILDALKKKC